MLTDATSSPPVEADPPGRRHPVARGFGLVLGWICVVLAAAGLTLHFLDTPHQTLIVLASGAWVLAPLSAVAVGLHLWRRAWVAVTVAVVIVALEVVVYAPLFVGQAHPSTPAATVHVLTQNMRHGEADATRLTDQVRTGDVDVFVAQELTGQAISSLRAAGLDRLLPYSEVDPGVNYSGTGIWSRYPISGERRLAAESLAGVVATLTLPGGVRVTTATVHPASPFPQDTVQWFSDLDHVRRVLGSLPSGPAFVGGDFNSTIDHARFRRLLVDGWHDGAQQAGAGLIRSWPSDKGIPPLIGIDHVLTRGAVATAVRTVAAPGSDHLGLLATVVVPRTA